MMRDPSELGAGHSVTALYEIVPAGASNDAQPDPIVYENDRIRPGQHDRNSRPTSFRQDAVLIAKIRYQQTAEGASSLVCVPAIASRHERAQ